MRRTARLAIVFACLLGLFQMVWIGVPCAPPAARAVIPAANQSKTATSLRPGSVSSLAPSNPSNYPTDSGGLQQKLHPNLVEWMRTGVAPANLRTRGGDPSIILWVNESVDWALIDSSVDVRSRYDLEDGCIVQGFARSPKALTRLAENDGIMFVMGDQRLDLTSDTPSCSQSGSPIPPHILGEELISLDQVQAVYPAFNGSGITIGVVDTGVDFGVSDLSSAYHVNASGYPTSFDPGGTGLAITSFVLPALRRGGGAGDYLLTAGLNFTMFRGDDGAIRTSDVYGVVCQDMRVGGYGGIVSQSSLYQVGMSVRTGAFGGTTGGPEDFWVTVSYGYENHPDDTPTWGTPAVWMNVTKPSSYLGAAIRNDTTYLGPHVTFKANWSELVIPEFPSIHIRQTRLEILTHRVQEHYGTIRGPVVGGWHPDLNPREAYDYFFCQKGDAVYVQVEFGTWVNSSDPTQGLIHRWTDDIDLFAWPPGVPHTYADNLIGPYTGCSGNPKEGWFDAPVTGNYTIGIDYYSGAIPMDWRCFVYAWRADALRVSSGRSAEGDTQVMGSNVICDLRTFFVTGTSLDADTAFTSHFVPRVTVTNFFPPTLEMVYPLGGELIPMGPVVIRWNGGDVNVEETLHYAVEFSQDSGLTWQRLVNDTTDEEFTWNARADLPLRYFGPVFRIRVTATDGKFTANVSSDLFELISPIDYIIPDVRWDLILASVVIMGTVLVIAVSRLIRRRRRLLMSKKLNEM